MYNGALADMGLGSDPFTGNRYAFTGGNPISNVEVDGHFAIAIPIVIALVAVAVVATDEVVAEQQGRPSLADSLGDALVSTARGINDAIDRARQPKSKPKPRPAPEDEDDDSNKCGSGWVQYGDVDKKNGSRATGMTSCLTKDYVDSHSGSETDTRVFTPPGYRWAQRTAGFLGARPIRENINACHLLANQLTGSGTDPRNLATCARGANAKQIGSQQGDNNMAKYEADIAAAVQAGQDVYYSVTPRYSGRRTVPTGFAIYAQGTNPDGSAGISIDTFISNTLAGRNLGMFNDPATGRQVPTGSME